MTLSTTIPTNLTTLIADAVAEDLPTYFPQVDIRRVYVPKYDLKDLQQIIIAVTVKSQQTDDLDRGANRDTHQVDVGVFLQVDPSKPAAVDAALDHVNAIKLLFAGDAESAAGDWEHQGKLREKQMAGADWDALSNERLYDSRQLDEAGLFASVITLDYIREE